MRPLPRLREGSPDSCLTGDYSERGITRLDGFARELVAEDAAQLIPSRRRSGGSASLAEPTSICGRAIRHARTIGGRQPWQLERALVLGAGAIGMLSTYLLRLAGIEVWTAGARAEGELVTRLRRALRLDGDVPLETLREEVGGFDLVIAAVPDAQVMAAPRPAPPQRRRLPPRHRRARPGGSHGQVIGVDTVLENRSCSAESTRTAGLARGSRGARPGA